MSIKITETQIVFPGTGNSNLEPDNQGPSLAIIVNNRPSIVDFGVGLLRQAICLSEELGGCISALDPKNLVLDFYPNLISTICFVTRISS